MWCRAHPELEGWVCRDLLDEGAPLLRQGSNDGTERRDGHAGSLHGTNTGQEEPKNWARLLSSKSHGGACFDKVMPVVSPQTCSTYEIILLMKQSACLGAEPIMNHMQSVSSFRTGSVFKYRQASTKISLKVGCQRSGTLL
jgi:hypothetical protein